MYLNGANGEYCVHTVNRMFGVQGSDGDFLFLVNVAVFGLPFSFVVVDAVAIVVAFVGSNILQPL